MFFYRPHNLHATPTFKTEMLHRVHPHRSDFKKPGMRQPLAGISPNKIKLWVSFYLNAKQNHLGDKKVQGQSEAAGRCDQNLIYQQVTLLTIRSFNPLNDIQ